MTTTSKITHDFKEILRRAAARYEELVPIIQAGDAALREQALLRRFVETTSRIEKTYFTDDPPSDSANNAKADSEESHE